MVGCGLTRPCPTKRNVPREVFRHAGATLMAWELGWRWLNLPGLAGVSTCHTLPQPVGVLNPGLAKRRNPPDLPLLTRHFRVDHFFI